MHSESTNQVGHSPHGPHVSSAPSGGQCCHSTRRAEEGTSRQEHADDAEPISTVVANGEGRGDYHVDETAMAQIIAVAILEFGIVVHSLIVGFFFCVLWAVILLRTDFVLPLNIDWPYTCCQC